jgi:hypothetical protein
MHQMRDAARSDSMLGWVVAVIVVLGGNGESHALVEREVTG